MSRPKSKKRTIIFILTGVVLAGATLVAYYSYQGSQHGSRTTDKASSPKVAATNETLRSEAVALLRTDGVEASQKKLDEALATTTSDKDKSYIYELKSSVVTSSQNPDYTQALEYAYKAEALNPTYETALSIAEYENELHHTDKAIQYYKLYLERSVTSDGKLLDPEGRTFYENKLKDLES